MNKQPFYHCYVGEIYFTATEPLTEDEFKEALTKGLANFNLVEDTVELCGDYTEPEAGDPHDLMD